MKKITHILITFFFLAMLFSCEKEEKAPIGGSKITIGTTTGSTILYTTATVSSAVESIKGNKVIEHGHCWGTEANPVVEGNKTTLGSLSDVKTFTSQLDKLSANTSYYIRSYLTTEYETIYGKEISIKTIDYNKPTVTTTMVSGTTTYNIAFSGGNVAADGGLPVTARGVVWNTTSEPTITNKTGITADGNGTGSFISQLTNLQPSTTYYLKAYATNSKGTNYGNEISFTTKALPVLASLTTSSPVNITDNSVTLGGTIINDGNATITACGVCYSNSQNPTITDLKVTAAVSSGSFSVSVTGLLASTTYYCRAYASNSQGIAYGNEITIKTLETIVTDIDGNVYHTVKIGTQVWMVENLKTTKYNDGNSIPVVTSNGGDLSTGACCIYKDIEYNKTLYVALYNWYAINTSKLAPKGWHVPTNEEWNTLINYLGGENVAGGKLKENNIVHWNSPNTGATNSSGFSALPGGMKSIPTWRPAIHYSWGYEYAYSEIGESGSLWSSTSASTYSAYLLELQYNTSTSKLTNSGGKGTYFSVRCIKDY